MKYIRGDQSLEFKNSEVCTAYEYPFEDKDINGAVIKLSGRYPASGRVTNSVCKELVYIIHGIGRLVIEDKETKINSGDMMLIFPGEKYYFEGELEMLMPCTPAWYPEQHHEVE